MSRTILKLSIVLLIIVSLPLGFFLTKEISTLNENEEMVERVFGTQLESILTSLNRYSTSMVSGWAQSVDYPVPVDGEVMSAMIMNLFNNNPSIQAARFYSPNQNQVLSQYLRNNDVEYPFVDPPEDKLKKLREYLLESNYQKVESVATGEYVELFFILKTKSERTICQLLVDPHEYVRQGLGPQVQEISQDIFYIEIKDTLNNQIVFSTEGIEDINDNPGSMQSIPLWYIPHYQSGIRLKAKTVKELASERSQQSSFILWGMVLFVLVGLGFVIWNIRKEMKLAELKSEFVANVSHEIRTPLALISMYAETLMLKRIASEEKQANYLETIHKESNRLTAIVNRILNFSKIEKNKRKYDFRQIDMNKLIANTVESCSSHFQAKLVSCSFQPSAEEIKLDVDKEAVSDMLMNLIDNAIKYGKEGDKKVEIRISRKVKYAWLEVEDNGIGISAKDQKYIFDQFYRVTKGDLANKVKGSGLGLNMVKKIMIAHGGSIAVRSKLGEGSTFILKFPLKRNNHA